MNKEINKTLSWSEVKKEWDYFDDRIEKSGYRAIVHSDRFMGNVTVACKDDRYVPIISFRVFLEGKNKYIYSICVEDRNGNAILDGKTIGYFRFSEYTRENLEKAINFVLETFGCYNEDNTVPTKFKEIEMTF